MAVGSAWAGKCSSRLIRVHTDWHTHKHGLRVHHSTLGSLPGSHVIADVAILYEIAETPKFPNFHSIKSSVWAQTTSDFSRGSSQIPIYLILGA